MKEIEFLRSANNELEMYLLSNQLYWHMACPGIGQSPLTPGNLLFTKAIIDGSTLNAFQQGDYERVWQQIENTRMKWNALWQKKASMEFFARLRIWENALIDFIDSRDIPLPHYRNETRGRVILQLLLADTGKKILGGSERLLSMDKNLRLVFNPGKFIWKSPLEPIFPKEEFWYLYMATGKG